MSSLAPRRYSAFISYRHADNRDAGRRWADWLHHQLETYAVPHGLVGKPNLRGDAIPPTLYPVFRDEEELPADADLSTNLHRALEASDTLIVLCSPRACASRFVADEIRTYKELGRSDRILAFMIDGEPNADDPSKATQGIRPDQENLPLPLRFGVPGPDGHVDWSRRTEPIAADGRPGGSPEQGYTSAGAYADALKHAGGRGGREIHALEREYAERLELARLKIVAGVLGVPLGQLRARDAVHRARRLRRLALMLGSLASVALVAALVAVLEGRRAEQNFTAAEAARAAQHVQLLEASRSTHAAAEREFRAGHWREGVCLLGRSLAYDSTNRAASAHLWSALAYGQGDRDEPPLAVWRFDGGIEAMAASPDGRWLAVATNPGELVLHDLASGERRHATLPPDAKVRRLRFHPTRAQILISAGVMQLLVARWDGASDEAGAAAGGALRVSALVGSFHDGAFSKDGAVLSTAGVRGGIQRFDTRTLRRLSAPDTSSGTVLSAAISSDATAALIQSKFGALQQLDLESGTEREITGAVASEPLFSSQLDARGNHLAQLGSGRLCVFELASGRAVVTPEEGVRLWPAFAFGADGRTCVVDARDDSLVVYALKEAQALTSRVRHPGYGLRAAFSADGRRLFTGGSDGLTAAWATPDGSRPGPRRLSCGPVEGGAWWTHERLALSKARNVTLWDVTLDRSHATLETGPAPGGLAVGPDGAWLAVGGPQGRIARWDRATLARVRELEGPPVDSYSLIAAATGPHLLVSGFDLGGGKLEQVLRVLDVTTGRAPGPDVRLGRLALAQGLSADGNRLLCLTDVGGAWRAFRVEGGVELSSANPGDIRVVEGRDTRQGVGELVVSSAADVGVSRSIVDLYTRLPRSEPLGEPGSRSIWSPDGLRLLSIEADGAAVVYDTPSPAPPGPWLLDLVAAASGLTLGEGGLGRPLDVAARHAARARLLGARDSDSDWDRLLRWWLTPLGERAPGP